MWTRRCLLKFLFPTHLVLHFFKNVNRKIFHHQELNPSLPDASPALYPSDSEKISKVVSSLWTNNSNFKIINALSYESKIVFNPFPTTQKELVYEILAL